MTCRPVVAVEDFVTPVPNSLRGSGALADPRELFPDVAVEDAMRAEGGLEQDAAVVHPRRKKQEAHGLAVRLCEIQHRLLASRALRGLKRSSQIIGPLVDRQHLLTTRRSSQVSVDLGGYNPDYPAHEH